MNKKFIKSFKNKENTYLNISLGIYIALVAVAIIGFVILFAELNPQTEPSNAGYKHLKFFTIDSNILMTIFAVVSIVYIILKKTKTINEIGKPIYILNLVGTTGVALTMFTTLFFLVPFSGVVHEAFFTPKVLLTGSNLIFHVINPSFAVIAFICFFKTNQIELKETLYSLIPIVIYSIFYLCMAYTHIDPTTGKPQTWFDWYKFCSFGVAAAPFILIGMYGIAFMLTWLLWLGNRKVKPNKLIFEFAGCAVVIAMGLAGTIWGFICYSAGPADFCKWFTNLSNWLMIIAFIVYLVFLSLKTSKIIKDIPQGIYVFQLTGIVAAALTLFGVILFLLPTVEDKWGIFDRYNLFFHLLLPIAGITTFVLFEHNTKIKFRYLWICVVPMYVYLHFYFAMYFAHGTDWYNFIKTLGSASTLVFPSMVAAQFLLAWLMWFGNRNIRYDGSKVEPYFKKIKKANY